MFRPTSRLIARSLAQRPVVAPLGRRFVSTAPPAQKSRSWKSLFARVGIAGAVVYYYNTVDVFAEEPRVPSLPETEDENEVLPTIDAISRERQQRREAEIAAAQQVAASSAEGAEGEVGVEELEEEAGQQGAFNPETGEINWDCPCLGGMAHGPCGEEFKAAFSCFVFSTEEPKGMDCVEKFKGMQTCFREYPEIYGSELDTDEDLDESAERDQSALADASASSEGAPTQSEKVGAAAPKDGSQRQPSPQDREARVARANAAAEQVSQEHGDADQHYAGPSATKSGEPVNGPGAATQQGKVTPLPVKKDDGPLPGSGEDLLPKAAYDDRDANKEVGKQEKN